MEMKDAKDFSNITAEELYRWTDRTKDLILIDTLPKEVFDKRHLPGAKNACVYQVGFPSEVEAIVPGRDRQVVLYGSSNLSHDARTAAEKLVRLGYRKVFILTGGLAAWREAGYPLEGSGSEPLNEGDRFKLEDHSYGVDTDQSVIEWSGRNPNTKHYGTLRLSGGEITVRDERILGAFEIDMRSIKNVNLEGSEWQPVLIAHLLSDDFFFVERFPKAVFTIDSAKLVGDLPASSPNLEVEGTLELRGVRSAIKFPAIVNRLEDGAIAAEAHFDFDRTVWQIIYGSSRYFEHLGMHLVFDPISIELHIVAR
jgi:rhodanese-related sulfurtransferase/polyisoprenoid-binding protein YceI